MSSWICHWKWCLSASNSLHVWCFLMNHGFYPVKFKFGWNWRSQRFDCNASEQILLFEFIHQLFSECSTVKGRRYWLVSQEKTRSSWKMSQTFAVISSIFWQSCFEYEYSVHFSLIVRRRCAYHQFSSSFASNSEGLTCGKWHILRTWWALEG